MMVSASTAITMRDVLACECLFAILLQLRFDLLRQFQANAFDARDFLRLSRQYGFDRAKPQNQFLAAGRPQPGNGIQARHQTDFTTSAAVRGDCEAVSFIPDALNEV